MPLYMQKQEQDNDLGDINGIIYNYNIAKILMLIRINNIKTKLSLN